MKLLFLRLSKFTYESESQTLTSAAESNVLKYKELTNQVTKEEAERWLNIKKVFQKNNKLQGFGNQNAMAQILDQMIDFSENLKGIKEVLKSNFKD